MLKAVIIDDEKNGRDTLNYLVNTYCGDKVKIVSMAENVKDGMEAIELYNPNIVFLDIQMQGETGFDLLSQIGEINFSVIFTTAYDKYALHAIKFSAIDYLLKPIDVVELNQAIDKASEKNNFDIAQYDNYIKNSKNLDSENMKIAISTMEGLVFIFVNQIVYCKAEKGYTMFYNTNGSKIISTKNMKHFEDILTEYQFLRIHNSYLINLKEIKKYNKGDGGTVVMSNDAELDVSKRKKLAFLAAIVK